MSIKEAEWKGKPKPPVLSRPWSNPVCLYVCPSPQDVRGRSFRRRKKILLAVLRVVMMIGLMLFLVVRVVRGVWFVVCSGSLGVLEKRHRCALVLLGRRTLAR